MKEVKHAQIGTPPPPFTIKGGGIVLHQGREVKIPCMATVSLMTTFALMF